MNANAVQVQTASAALGEVVTGDQIRDLPLNGRNFAMLTQLQPGVSATDNFDAKNKGLLTGVDFSVNGNATTSNLFLVDGPTITTSIQIRISGALTFPSRKLLPKRS